MKAGVSHILNRHIENAKAIAPEFSSNIRHIEPEHPEMDVASTISSAFDMDFSDFASADCAGISVFDCHGRYVAINEALASINGLSPKEHLGQRLKDIIPHLDPLLRDLTQTVQQSASPIFDIKLQAAMPKASDPPRDWLVSIIPVPLPSGVLGVAHVVLETTGYRRFLHSLMEHNRIPQPPSESELTMREFQVLQLLGSGKTTKQIAALLHISSLTVGNHRKSIAKKLGVHSTAEMVACAAKVAARHL